MKIDTWSDIACPFCYIGIAQLNRALGSFAHKDKVELVHRSFLLDPEAPDSTDQSQMQVLADKKGMPIEQVEAMFKQTEATARQNDLEINFRKVIPVSTRLGHGLIHFAATKNKADQAVTALFEAYFRDGKNVADKTTLVDIAVSIGLDSDETKSALESAQLQDEVNSDIAQAAQLGIRGVPFFLINDKYALSGAQGEATFSEVLQKVWHETNPITQLGNAQAPLCVDGLCLPNPK